MPGPAWLFGADGVSTAMLFSPAHVGMRLLCRRRAFQWLSGRLLAMGCAVGLLAGALMWANQAWAISLFTRDPATVAVLRGRLWAVLCVAQPINAAVFVYDGLIYAVQAFAYTRTVMLSGFCIVFAPLLALSQWQLRALYGVWAAKAVHNMWRLAGAALCIHVLYERQVRSGLADVMQVT